MKPLAPDTLLQGRYRVKEIIGKGGMGEVYLATDSRLGNEVALKRTTVGEDDMLAAAFEREARTLAALRHPVLPKVSDHFIEKDEQFLIMDYIEGEDLSKRLKETGKPFPVSWVLFWADQLLEALTYLHTQVPPIIHRDIKPQNLKLTGENQIVLLDFGLSKHALGPTRVTTSGSVVGFTPHYAPMEQIRGTGTNAKSDIYALCATLYHLLTNTVPHDALKRADSLLSNQPDPLVPPSELNGSLPEPISDAIMHGMEISQDSRFGSAREMQKVLRKAYRNLKKSAAAETAVFNVGEIGVDETAAPDAKTEMTPAASTDTVPNAGTESAKLPPQTGTGATGMEPSGEVTEAFDAEGLEADTFVAGDAVSEDAPSDIEAESAGEEDETGLGEPVGDATVPMVPLDGKDGRGRPFEVPVGTAAGTAAGAGTESAAPPPRKRKGSGVKIFAAVTGVAAILLLVVGSVGAALWYFGIGGGITREGTDQPAANVETTPETAAEKVSEDALTTGPDREDANSNTGAENANTNTVEKPVTAAPDPAKQPSGTRTQPAKRPVLRKTPVRRATPVKRPVRPKKTPAKKKKDPGVL